MVDAATLGFLVAAAFVAAFVDSMVGGGGIISLPALLAAGLPPHLALGTNKMASTGASLMASVRFAQARLVQPRLVLSLFPLAFLGAVLGALAVLQVDPDFVRGLVVAVMVLMLAWVLLRPAFGREDRFAGLEPGPFAAVILLALVAGFYDGFLGPGTGTFLLFGFVALLGFDFLRAAGHARVLNFGSNLGALLLFALRDSVDYAVGLPMFAAMLAGAFAGSHFAIRHGARWIKPLFVAVTLALLLRLLWPGP